MFTGLVGASLTIGAFCYPRAAPDLRTAGSLFGCCLMIAGAYSSDLQRMARRRQEYMLGWLGQAATARVLQPQADAAVPGSADKPALLGDRPPVNTRAGWSQPQ